MWANCMRTVCFELQTEAHGLTVRSWAVQEDQETGVPIVNLAWLTIIYRNKVITRNHPTANCVLFYSPRNLGTLRVIVRRCDR